MSMPWLGRLFSKALNGIRLWGNRKHAKNIKASRRVIEKLSSFEHDAQALAYLRKIDPLIFEDVALSLLENRGVLVLRSTRYSGDGGLDGRFLWPGRGWHAVQCKRYGRAITPAHARAFAELAARKFKGGLFVHTGRTGDSSQEALAGAGLCILSGSDLARCCRDKHADPLALALARKARAGQRASAKPAKPVSNPRPAPGKRG